MNNSSVLLSVAVGVCLYPIYFENPIEPEERSEQFTYPGDVVKLKMTLSFGIVSMMFTFAWDSFMISP